MVEAMLHVLRTGCPWRDLPSDFGPWGSVYTRWSRWCETGLWAAVLDALAQKQEGVLRSLDATHIKVHQDAANPAGGQENQGCGRTKGGLNTKLTALVDTQGHALQLTLAPGQMADVHAAKEIVLPSAAHVVGDKGCDSDEFCREIQERGSKPCVPPRKGRKAPRACHRGYYKKRHRVENFFQRVKRFRRVGTRYEKLALNFLGFVHLAAVMDWLKT
jgi:transposase